MKPDYLKFLCRCGQSLANFQAFKSHVSSSKHGCQDVSLKNTSTAWKGQIIKQKFYWTFICLTPSCKKRKFSSGAITALIKLHHGENPSLTVEKKYPLLCLKCKKEAQFENYEQLDQHLIEKAQQRLIYAKYKNNFPAVAQKERELEGHIQELCSRCQELGYLCLTEHQAEANLTTAFGQLHF